MEGEDGQVKLKTYSFAKTPLKAAQAPLAIATATHPVRILTGLAVIADGGEIICKDGS
jgi:hypothetical protein